MSHYHKEHKYAHKLQDKHTIRGTHKIRGCPAEWACGDGRFSCIQRAAMGAASPANSPAC